MVMLEMEEETIVTRFKIATDLPESPVKSRENPRSQSLHGAEIPAESGSNMPDLLSLFKYM